MGFISSKHYVNYEGYIGYTGLYDSDTDLVEVFFLNGPDKGKRKIVDIWNCEVLKNGLIIELLFDGVKREPTSK